MSDYDDLVGDLDEIDLMLERERRALMMLLDRQRERSDHLFSVAARMGATRSFITSVSLEWVAKRVRLANELPMFHEYLDPETDKIRVDWKTASMIQQREPDWTRQYPMTVYLAHRKHHKFPPILVVVTQPWVDNARADEWSKNFKALRDSVSAQAIDSEGRFQDLHLSESDLLYAIDGQHRLMAIQGLSDLLMTGRLFQKKKNGRDGPHSLSIDEIVKQSHDDIKRSDLQALLSERIGIEIIPAVEKGETITEALLRLRSIFVHVNQTAKRLTKGQLALLDEDNGFAIVARLAMVDHTLLKDRVELDKSQLAASSPHLTTLDTLRSIARKYLGQYPEFSGWGLDTKSQMHIRPEEESINRGYAALERYLDALARLPSYQKVTQGKPAEEFREKQNHLLFRPLAQVALAEAVSCLETRDASPVSLSTLFGILKLKDTQGVFDITKHEYPWYGSVWKPDSRTMERAESARVLCMRLFRHLLGGGTTDDKERQDLTDAFARARLIDPERESEEAVDLEGHRVKRSLVQLPSPW